MKPKKMSYGKNSKLAAGLITPRKRMAMGDKMPSMKKKSKKKY